MRGDLVYEKLGEIDPALIEEALPNNVPPVLVSSLFEKPKRTYYFNAHKFAVICACLTLVAVILIGGGVILSRMVDLPWEAGTTETQPNPNFNPASLAYEGTVSIEGLGELGRSDAQSSLSGEIREAFNSAELAEDVCECERYLSMLIGEDALTYNPEHGCFRDGETGSVYMLSSESQAFVNQALKALEEQKSAFSFQYEYSNLRYGDHFMFSLKYPLYGYVLQDIYLRSIEDVDVYYIDDCHKIYDVNVHVDTGGYHNEQYYATIPSDAPLGEYKAFATFIKQTGQLSTVVLESETPVLTVAVHEKAPAYTFYYDDTSVNDRILTYGDYLTFSAGMQNDGDTIYRIGFLHPNAELRTEYNGTTVSFALDDITDGGVFECIRSLESDSVSSTEYGLKIDENLPSGIYDLVLSFEGHEQVFEKIVAISPKQDQDGVYEDMLSNHRYEISCESSVAVVGEERTITVSITHYGEDLYRYGSSACFAPDDIMLYCEKGLMVTTIPLQLENDTDDGLRIRIWKNGETLVFTYRYWISPGDLFRLLGSYKLCVEYQNTSTTVLKDVLQVYGSRTFHPGDSLGFSSLNDLELGNGKKVLSAFLGLPESDVTIPFEEIDGAVMATIPENAPLGEYYLVVTHEGENGPEQIIAQENYITVEQGETRYRLESDLKPTTASAGEWLEFSTSVTNEGTPIRLFEPYDHFAAYATLVAADGEYTLSSNPAPDARQPGTYTFETGKKYRLSQSFIIPDDMPVGVYHLVLTCRGETTVIENVVTIEKP